MNEVLQTETVFVNVSKGEVAKKADLEKAFKTKPQCEIILEILDKGQLQVSEKERSHEQDLLKNEIATLIATMCVNPANNRVYSTSMILVAMKEAHVNIKPTQSAKQQALHVIKSLSEHLPIERAQMRLCIKGQKKSERAVKMCFKELGLCSDDIHFENESFSLVALVHPGKYAELLETVSAATRNEAVVELLDIRHVDDDEAF